VTYTLPDGTVVPRVSEVIGELRPDDGYLDWISRLGPDWRETLQRYADRGTEVHELVAAHLRGEPVSEALASEDALARFDLFRSWWSRRKATASVVLVETPIVSAVMRYGGTPDLVVRTKGRLEVWDVKTSAEVRESHWIQAAAYCGLVSEHLGEPCNHGAILRLRADGPTLTRTKEMTAHSKLFAALYAVHTLRLAQAPTVEIREAA
jgi:predicted RecB family nuclease